MKAKIFTFTLLLAVFGVAQAQLEILKVPAGSEPTIDGAIDEATWQEDGWEDQTLNSAGSSTTDASSMFQLLHNTDNIFVGVQVTDATPHNETDISNTYERDCIELFFHMSDDPGEGPYTGSTSQLRFQRDGDGDAGMDGTGTMVTNLQGDDGFEWMVDGDDAGYVLEVVLPVAVLDGDAVFGGADFLFDIQTADNTTGAAGGRTQQMFWNDNSDQQWQDTKTFGAVTLSDTEISTAIAQVEAQLGSVWVANDMLNFKNVEGAVNIYSISGALVMKDVIERDGSIDISSLNTGIYIVNTKEMTAKIIK